MASLFGLAFLFGGLAAGYFSFGHMTIQYISTKDWVLVPAQIASVDLKVNSGESTTYRVEANYRYNYQGESYNSDNVSLSSGSDNVGTYWQDLDRKLRTDQTNNSAQAWVNPNNPAESVLDRTFRWAQVAFGVLFLLMFGGFGLGMSWLALRKTKTEAEQLELARADGISSNQKFGFWFLFWFASIFLLMGSFAFAMVLPDIINGDYAALFTLLFVIVGAGIMFFALRGRRRYKLIGPTPLFLDPLPGAIGGQVGGSFQIASVFVDKPITVKLTCQRRVKSGKNTSIKIIWQESMVAYTSQTSSGTKVQFVFDCPPDLPRDGENSVEWKTEADGQLSMNSGELEFQRSWNIPVNNDAIGTQSSIVIPAHYIDEQKQAKLLEAKTEAANSIKLNQHGQYLNVESAIARSILSGFFGILFGAIFLGIGVFTVSQDWWPGYIFIAIGLLIVLGSVFFLGRDVEIKIDTQARLLYMRRKWFGVVLYKREVMLFEPSQFSIKKTSSSQNGSNLTEYYAVKIDNQGSNVLVVEGIKGKEVATEVMRKIIKKAFPSRETRESIP